MPVTIKKKKTVRTIRTKRPAEGSQAKASQVQQAAPAVAAAPEQPVQPAIAAQPQNKPHNYGIDVTFALLTFLVFVVLIFVQVSEISYYKAYPGIWPVPSINTTSVTPTATNQ